MDDRTEVGRLDRDTPDHVVLVVSNCGVRSRRRSGEEHDDGRGYVLKLDAS